MPAINPPADTELQALMGPAWAAWQSTRALIESLYEMETLWFSGRGENVYEFKYRRGGKTLCALYPRRGGFGFMVILGAAERERFEARAADFAPETLAVYRATKTYHDGLWLMLPVTGDPPAADMEALLRIKRRPNKK